MLEGREGREADGWRVGARARHRRPLANAWRINLCRSVTSLREKPRPRLVELVPAPIARDDARYLVRVRDLAIELVLDFDDETLVRLVRALRSC